MVTGSTEAPEMRPIPDLSVTLEDKNIHLISSYSSSATGQIGISTGVGIPSALLESGVSQ